MLNENTYERLISFTNKEREILDKKNIKYVFEKYFNEEEFKDQYISIKRHTRFIEVPEHSHNFIELMYVFRGKMTQIINGREIILKKGEILLLNQYIYHEIDVTSEEDIIINFIIDPQFFDNVISLFDSDNIINKFILNSTYRGIKQGEYIYFQVGEIESIQNILKDIIEEMYKVHLLKNAKIKFNIGILLTELLTYLDFSNFYSDMSFDNRIVTSVLKYIDNNYYDASLEEISRVLNQPNYKISRLLKKFTGKNFSELLIENKVEKAKELLRNTDYPITDIIKRIGYENRSHFYKIFKSKNNVSLKEFRKNKLI